MTNPRPTQPQHDCPGRCGVQVEHRLLACPSCWYRLPVDMRRAVTMSRDMERLRAVSRALRWYRENTS
jgi:hypothetical protein